MSNAKSDSSYTKQINRLRKHCAEISEANIFRKYQIHQFNLLVKKLLSEGRISVDEIKGYFEKKEEVKKNKIK